MFDEKDSGGRALQIIGASAAAAIAAWILARATAPGHTREEQALVRATTALVKQSEDFTKPVSIAVNDGMAEFLDKHQARQEELRKTRAAEREERQPKAYRWKDSAGQWHLSDSPPATGTAVQVIPLAELK